MSAGPGPLDGPRYPGSLLVWHAKQRAVELAAKYRRRKKRETELPRLVATLLAWEGAIVAGAFLTAIAGVAAGAYMMERFDERTRRTSLIAYYRQRVELSEDVVRDLQASLAFLSQHAQAVHQRAEASRGAAAACRQRLAARRGALEGELAGAGAWVLRELGGGGGGGGGGGAGKGAGGGGGAWRGLTAPWRRVAAQRQLAAWREELEAMDREASHAEESLALAEAMERAAGVRLRRLVSQLRSEAAAHDRLAARLAAWRAYSCRTGLLSASGELWVVPWWWGWRRPGEGGGGSGAAGAAEAEAGAQGAAVAVEVEAVGAAGAAQEAAGVSRWNWSVEVTTPAWMDEDDCVLAPGAPVHGEEGEGRDGGEEGDGEEEGEGDGGGEGEGEEGGWGEWGMAASLAAALTEVGRLLEGRPPGGGPRW
ncbi:hypothetical protein HYH03_006619 [Edaphochlamys debaryana]|uniref:Uncharacterized protein n=1 Tax=Edaphochlamys debaryana TaxID=47281 RepID=A0A835YAJ3_9CHLO|nr:hypothetical protein HYH03_006619 [Edaphochlamys debaryana]|eukprot:KAG2495350.1 hypothetical protein HYH03_006619 [Edaphochlamys debaryana]